VSPLTPDPAAPLYQTDLAQTPLPEILVKIHRYKAPGRIECSREQERKRIYLEHGQIVFARAESDDVDPLQLQNSGLSREELFDAVRQRIETIVWSIFTWTNGTASFTPGRSRHLEFVKSEIPVPQAVLRGVRFMPDAKAIVARLGGRTVIFERMPGDLDPTTLDAGEAALYEAVDGRRSLGDLVAVPPLSSGDNARVLYAFLLLGMIAPRHPRPITIKVNVEGKPTD